MILILTLLFLGTSSSFGAGMSNAALSSPIGESQSASLSSQTTPSSTSKFTSAVKDLQSSPSTNDINAAMQKYNSIAGSHEMASPPQVSADGTVTYRYRMNGAVMEAACNSTGCGSTGSVSCGENQIGLLDGTCNCADGYEWRGGMSVGQGFAICVQSNQCPSGTFMMGHAGADRACQCDNNPNQTIAPGAPNTCRDNQQISGNCGPDPRNNNFSDDDDVAVWDQCIREAARQAEIEAQRLENQREASQQAAAAAQRRWGSEASDAASRIAGECRDAGINYNQSCQTLRSVPGGTSANPSSSNKSACESQLRSLTAGIESVRTNVSECTTLAEAVVSACPDTTGPVSAEGSHTADTGANEYGGAVIANDSAAVTRPQAIPQNSSVRNSISGKLANLIEEAGGLETNLENSANGARSCIASFTSEPEEEEQVAASGRPSPTETTPVYEPSPTTRSGSDGPSELANGKPSAGDILTGLSGLASSLNTGGGGSFEPAFPSPPGFKSTNSQGNQSGFNGGGGGDSSGASLSSNKTLDLGARASAGGDDLRGLGDINGSEGNNAGFNGQGGANANNQQQQGNQASAGSQSGGQAARLAASDGNAGSGRNNNGARRGSVASRNLIGGYKNIKPTDGGGSLSIRSSDMKKYGRTNMKAKLDAARKTFGLEVPLMFKNGKFVRDFLAMKEGKGFKSRQAAMESYWKGNNRKNTVGEHECVSLNECHTNEKASIFKLMNFRLQKSFYKVNIEI